MNDLILYNENDVIVDRKILSIEEYVDENKDRWSNDEGFTIKTSDGSVIDLHMGMEQGCCECPGYFMSEDDFSDYIGANLIKVEVVDTGLRKYTINEGYGDEDLESSLDAGGVMFVNLETTKGTLQFVAYNSHNGYYGHMASVSINKERVYEDCV